MKKVRQEYVSPETTDTNIYNASRKYVKRKPTSHLIIRPQFFRTMCDFL